MILESETAFSVGSLVLIDLKFPNQVYTYRSHGVVSWVVEGPGKSRLFKLGVLIFGMDKLDEHGVSLSIAAPSPIGRESKIDTDPPSESVLQIPDPELIEHISISQKDDKPAPDSVTQKDPHSISGELVSLCATDDKIARWLANEPNSASSEITDQTLWRPQSFLDEIAKSETIFLSSENVNTELAENRAKKADHIHEIDDDDLESLSKPEIGESTDNDTMSSSPPELLSPEQDDLDINIEVDFDHRFDSENKMIEAFERMHHMYMEQDREGAARFALALSCDLVMCEVGRCLLVSPDKYELDVVAYQSPVSEEILHAPRPVSGGVTGFAIRTGVATRVADPENDQLYEQDVDDIDYFETINILSSPIHHHGHTIGAIELRNSPRKGGFVQGEANLVSYIASAMADYVNTILPIPNHNG
ncbi:MAG: GAF domain-containing protein [Proteobacteria bacterium]|nr:GAF domain-containing protein [Pseudomonadota bacterium]